MSVADVMKSDEIADAVDEAAKTAGGALAGLCYAVGSITLKPVARLQESEALAALRVRLSQALDSHAPRLDYGLIHADLVRENVFITNGGVAFIDFDDCGPGYRLFDIATTLLKNRGEPTYPAIERALIAGYRSRRSLSDETLAALPLFLTLRSLTYIGWLAQRPETPNAAGRLSRYLKESLQLADALQIEA